MGASAQPGPLSVIGQTPAVTGPTNPIGGSAVLVPDYNSDAAPSLFWGGTGMRDPRYLPKIGGSVLASGAYSNQDVGWYSIGGAHLCAHAPAVKAVNNIAVAANVVISTPMTLVSSTAAGITVISSAYTVLPTGLVVPSGSKAIDGNPGWLGAGQSGAFAFFDPTKSSARAVSITGSGSATGGNFLVSGYDIYGVPMSELITATGGATTTNGKKAFKWIASVTPAFTDAHNYSVGTTDIFGFPMVARGWPNVSIWWDNTLITANTGFVAAVATSPATTTTGDTRGTYAPTSASDGAKVLVVRVHPAVADVAAATVAAQVIGLVGVTQA